MACESVRTNWGWESGRIVQCGGKLFGNWNDRGANKKKFEFIIAGLWKGEAELK